MYPETIVKISLFFLLTVTLASCTREKKIYISGCNDGHEFKRISIANLADSLSFYNNKYVEVSGKYQQDKALSILVGDNATSIVAVEFSNECPLYLTGTRTGFFDYDNNNGQLTPANNKIVILRGEVICHKTANVNSYKASISHISYVQL